MRYSIHYTDSAVQDLEETLDYIDHVLLNPTASDRLLETLGRQLEHLSDLPQTHAVVDDPFFRSCEIRFAVVNNYLVFYTIDANRHMVLILRFLYGRRDWLSLLKEEYPIL